MILILFSAFAENSARLFLQSERGCLTAASSFLCLLYEFFPAPGAGDGDFSFAPGDSHHLAALGAVEVAVLPVFYPVKKLEELPVFLITLIGIPGQAAENRPEHHAIA